MNGYPTDEPCEECGQVKNNFIEPRFNYISCDDCKSIDRTGNYKPTYKTIKMESENKK